MEKYLKPEATIIRFQPSDVISASNGGGCFIFHEDCHTEGPYSCAFGDRP